MYWSAMTMPTVCVNVHNRLCVLKLGSVHACRAVQCQQFEIALLLLEAGADPAYIGTADDGQVSLPPLTAVMHAIPPGGQDLIIQQLLLAPCFRQNMAMGSSCCMLALGKAVVDMLIAI